MTGEYKNKKVLIAGLGMSGGGVGVARFFAEYGARVTVADKKSKKELLASVRALQKYKTISYIFGTRPPHIELFDIIVINPKVDLRSPIVKKIKRCAQKGNVRIESEAGLFLKHCKGRVIAITGTKGKGTTATLIYRMLRREKKDAFIGGNIGGSLLQALPRVRTSTYVVFEISSFQLDLLALSKVRPNFFVSALTNIYQDHLDRYDSFTEYKKSKLSIFKYPARYKIDGRKISGRLPTWIDAKKIKLLGDHNKKNIAIAIRAGELLKIKRKNIAKAIYGFSGLPHRLEYLGVKRGILFYNDSYSTTPDSTIAALRSFPFDSAHGKQLILIAGGVSKGSSFSGLAKEASRSAKKIILFGKSKNEIAHAFHKQDKIIKTKTLHEAYAKALHYATKGDTVLFSPACASFDQFQNARERGETFRKLVRGK